MLQLTQVSINNSDSEVMNPQHYLTSWLWVTQNYEE